MSSLQTQYAGLTLRNPLIAASCGLTNTISKIKELDQAGVGAIVLKSLFEEQIDSHADKLSFSSDYPEANDYINTYIQMNHVDRYLNLLREAKAECSVPIIASINCYKNAKWTEFAKEMEYAGADAIELNVFAVNSGERSDNFLEEAYLDIVREVRKVVKVPIIVKMGKTISNISGLVQKLYALGANAVVLFNRYYQLDIDITSMEITSGNVFSSRSDFSDTMRWTAIVSGRVPNMDIACSNGVHSWEDAIKGILAGATAIQLCSVLYEEGISSISEMSACIEEWMAMQNFKSIAEFKGRLSYANIPDPTLYERVQFMKYFSDKK